MTTTTSTAAAFDPARMGVEDFKAAIAAGTTNEAKVLGILDDRIKAREAKKKAPIAGVIRYRNELAAKLGVAAIAEPVYAQRQAIVPVQAGKLKPEEIARSIHEAGLTSVVIGELTKLAHQASA